MDRLPREISRLEAPGTTPPENPAHPFWMIDISPIGEKHHGPEHRNPLTAGDISQEKTTSITSTEIPSGTRVEIQSDGQQTLVYGDSRRASEFNHVPGMNDVGYKNTEGIVECEIALRLAGISFPERDLVNLAIRHRLCESYVRSTDSGNVTYPIISGGTTLKQRAELIQQAGIPTELKSNVTIEDLAAWVKAEKAAIIPSSRWQEQDGGWVKTNESYVVVGAALDAQNPRHIVEFSALKAGEKGIQRLSPELLQSIWQEEKQGVALLVDTLKKQEAERPSFIGDTTQHAASTTLVETIHDIHNLEPLDPAAFKPSYLDFAPLLRERGLLSEQDIPWRRSFAATPEQREVYDRLAEGKISCFRGTLSDGREVLIAGDVQAA
ncbi:MAG: hypothetical protein J2P36_19115, partial [Ktedonobacteraceae bacterium]|nr:hypothetical protein [Ktedonobacteraceae bacterium]